MPTVVLYAITNEEPSTLADQWESPTSDADTTAFRFMARLRQRPRRQSSVAGMGRTGGAIEAWWHDSLTFCEGRRSQASEALAAYPTR